MKKIIFRSLVSLLVIVCLTAFSFADGNAYGLTKQQLDAYFSQLEAAKTFNGAVLVAKEGKIIFTKGYGMANFEKGIRNKSKTVFSIASLTKAFASMSIMIMEERGLLSVEDTIADFIPEFPNGDQVTLHHLLSHSSGLFEYLNNPFLWGNYNIYHDPEELLPYYMNEPLQFLPGSQMEYCNSNYVTLGIIIERVSGMSFRDFIKANILDPLKMDHTGYDPLCVDFPDIAIGYDLIDPPLVTLDFHLSIAYTAGAMCSTVEDLYKWDQALYTEKLISAASLQKMFSPGLGDYGYGWFISDLDVNGEMYDQIWHWGAYFGFHSFISRLVDEKLTVILLLNISPTLWTPDDLLPLVRHAAGIVLENH